MQKTITDLSVIFNPVGDDLFKPLRIAPIHPFPSLLASASWKAGYIKTMAQKRHGHARLWWTCPMEYVKKKKKKLTSDFIISATVSLEKHSSIIDFLKSQQGLLLAILQSW